MEDRENEKYKRDDKRTETARLNRVRATRRKGNKEDRLNRQLKRRRENKKRKKERSGRRYRVRKRARVRQSEKEEIDSPVPPPVPPVRALSAACFMSS